MKNVSLNENSIWKPFEYFIGSWEGKGEGKSGVSDARRQYDLVLNDNFILIKNASEFQPQEKNLKGEIHENMDFLSYDKGRSVYVLRQFHCEGFANQYTLNNISDDCKVFEFETEIIENGPNGLKARVIIEILNDNEFEERFELSFPGNNYGCYNKNHFIRK